MPDSSPPPTARIPPMVMVAMAAAAGVAVVLAIVILATGRPFLGIAFSAGGDQAGLRVERTSRDTPVPTGTMIRGISGNGDSLDLESLDITAEPDGSMGTFAAYRRFLERQERISRILASASVELRSAEGEVFVLGELPRSRPLASFPPDFWVQLAVGLIAWLLSAAVFAFRTRDPAARLLLFSGASTLLFAPAAALYSTRELALPGTMFHWANDLNFLGGSLFAASFVALLLCYPRRIAPPWVGRAVTAIFLVWFVFQECGVFESMTFARRFLVMVGMFATFMLAAVQWFGSRREPLARAALIWFLISWLLGSSLFGLCILLPQMFGVDTSEFQGYAFLLFLLVYAGLAFGIVRYRLFDLGDWWRQVVVATSTVLLLVLLDVILAVKLGWSAGASLSVALFVSALLWVPLRFWLWAKILPSRGSNANDLFGRVLDLALVPPNGGNRGTAWSQLLKELFQPLNQMESPTKLPEVMIERDGLAMTIPAVGTLAPVTMEFANKGRRLFSGRDAALATEVVSMLAHALESHESYAKGVAEERRRITLDIHDNIASQLLAALHRPDPSGKDARIRESLSEIRELIDHDPSRPLALEESLGELRADCMDRLSSAGIRLDWTCEGDIRVQGGHVPHALRSIIREAVTNVIKHSGASRMSLSVLCRKDELAVIVSDDGKGFPEDDRTSGHGMANIRERVRRLGGRLEIGSSDNQSGARLALTVPLP